MFPSDLSIYILPYYSCPHHPENYYYFALTILSNRYISIRRYKLKKKLCQTILNLKINVKIISRCLLKLNYLLYLPTHIKFRARYETNYCLINSNNSLNKK